MTPLVGRTARWLACALLLAASQALAAESLDQISDATFFAGDGYAVHSSHSQAQTLTSGTSGLLSRIELQITRKPTTTEPLVLDLRPVTAGVPVANDASVLASIVLTPDQVRTTDEVLSGQTTSWNVLPARIAVRPGQQLAIVARAGTAASSDGYTWLATSWDNYAPGLGFSRQSSPGFFWVVGDHGFATYVEQSITFDFRAIVSTTDADFAAGDVVEGSFTFPADLPRIPGAGETIDWQYFGAGTAWQVRVPARGYEISGSSLVISVGNDNQIPYRIDRYVVGFEGPFSGAVFPSGRTLSLIQFDLSEVDLTSTSTTLLDSDDLPLLPPALADADSLGGRFVFTNNDHVFDSVTELSLHSSDSDGDGFEDVADNCPAASNASQADADGDFVGDPCDACPADPSNDVDFDFVCGAADNCQTVVNPNQADGDGDLLGDPCDPCPTDPANDPDQDSVCAALDNCPDDPNPGQQDMDDDEIGDACDPNRDGDDTDDVLDTCPSLPNPGASQLDSDLDGIGDLCDACPLSVLNDSDADGACGGADNCPSLANPDQRDANGDGEGDACDPDLDGDGFENASDNCPTIHNDSQADADEDLLGDACDQNAPTQETTVSAGNLGQVSQTPTLRWRFVPSSPLLSEGGTAILPTGECVVANISYTGSLTEVRFGFLRYVPNGFACCAWRGDCPNNGSCFYSEDHCFQEGSTTYCSTSFAWGDQANEAEIHSDGDSHPDLCDNCPEVTNDDQADADGDGQGDACECGDVDGNGVVQGPDASRLRFALAGLAPIAHAPKCNVLGAIDENDSDQNGLRDDCNVLDSVILRRATASPALSTVDEVCAAAGGP